MKLRNWVDVMSKIYNQLIACEKKLQKIFITKKVLKDSSSETSQYQLRAYRILLHAEIEEYIENLILQKIILEKEKWQRTHKIPHCIACLIAYNTKGFPNISKRLSEISTKNDINFRINTIISNFQSQIQELDQMLLNNLSSFGTNRGTTVHHSSKVQKLINPNDEVNTVTQIITSLKEIDDLVI